MSRRAVPCALALAVLVACHRQQGGAVSARDVITQEQIDSTGYLNVYDVITRLHAEYLIDRGPVSIKTNQHARAVVFLNAQEYGIPETLRNFPAGGVSQIRYYRGTDAVAKFGAQYGGGVIQLISRTQ